MSMSIITANIRSECAAAVSDVKLAEMVNFDSEVRHDLKYVM